MSRVVATVRGKSSKSKLAPTPREVVALTAKLARASGLVQSRRKKALPKDPLESAKAAHLRHVDASLPGLSRKSGKTFIYVRADGKPVKDESTLKRIRSLVIPPAWTNVWICAAADGHIQATGRDARGRKQYRYHPKFREIRDETKYERMLSFADALPGIRTRVDHDLGGAGLTREKVLATVVRLLEVTLIRVGNEEYARENASFGLTRARRWRDAGLDVYAYFDNDVKVRVPFDAMNLAARLGHGPAVTFPRKLHRAAEEKRGVEEVRTTWERWKRTG